MISSMVPSWPEQQQSSAALGSRMGPSRTVRWRGSDSVPGRSTSGRPSASIFYASAALWLFEVLDAVASIVCRDILDQGASRWLHLTTLAATIMLIAITAKMVADIARVSQTAYATPLPRQCI